MSFQVTASEPIYLESVHSNIPLKEKWNTSLGEGLRALAEEVESVDKEVYRVEVQRNDDYKEFDAQGDYSLVNSEYGTDVPDEGDTRLVLRAFFVRSTRS
jgi:hypothetical protein